MTPGKYIRTKEMNEKNRRGQLKRFEDPKEGEKIRQANLGNKYVLGKHWKLSDEAKEKHRMAILGQKRTLETRKKLRIPKTEEHKEKLRQSAIKQFEDPNAREKLSQIQSERFKDPKEREKSRLAQLHLFSALDRLIKNKYCPLFTPKLREEVRIRDSHTCQLCGVIQNGRKHTCHHIHYDKPNCYPDLICLCNRCNIKVNFNKKYWENFFMNTLNNRQLLFWTRNRNISNK